MSNEEKKEGLQEGEAETSEAGFEDKIEAAMSEIIADTVDTSKLHPVSADKRPPRTRGVVQGKQQKSAKPKKASVPKQAKSARPQPVAYVPIDDDEMQIPVLNPKKKHKGLKVTGIAAAMLVVAAGCAYGGISYYYSDKFFEGTVINGIDCSGKTAYQAEKAIASVVEDYSIQVASRNLDPQTIEGEQINYQYMSDGEVLALLKRQKPYEWVRGLFEQRSYTTAKNISYDKTMLQNQVKELNCAKEENQVAPEDAYVAYTDTQFEIIPETEGSKLDIKQAYRILDEAVSGSQETVDFGSEPDAYVKAAVTKDDPELQSAMDACNNYTKASITYTFGDETVTLDGATIKDWLQLDEKGQLIRDDATFQQHIAEYVANLASTHDTVGTDREFHTTSGRTVYVYGSAYGWQIDQGRRSRTAYPGNSVGNPDAERTGLQHESQFLWIQ